MASKLNKTNKIVDILKWTLTLKKIKLNIIVFFLLKKLTKAQIKMKSEMFFIALFLVINNNPGLACDPLHFSE